ncbi:hypothetical protein J6TS2_49060 [Heyndrickxia sporothermodurans]|nr:hypothetical protein J6TS2_49060 [Heyndrickxia sporothermodurans]
MGFIINIECFRYEFSFKVRRKADVYASDQLTTIEEEKGITNQEKIHISYNTQGKVDKVQFADHWTEYFYDGDRLVQTSIHSEKTEKSIVEKFEYSSQNQLTKYIDGKKNVTTFSYDENELKIFDQQASGEELSVTNTYSFNMKDNEFTSIATDDTETIYTRDLDNKTFAVATVSNPQEEENQLTTSYKYDANYNLLKQINPDGTIETFEYDNNGNIIKETTSEGTTINKYDNQNQLIESKNPSGVVTTNEYNEGELVKTQTGDEITKYDYDQYGRQIKVTYPNGTYEVTQYNDDSYQVTQSDAKGNTATVQYTVYGQKKAETDPEGNQTIYSYDPLYFVVITSVTDGNGHKTSYQYDNNGNLLFLTDALNRKKSYEYNNNDQIIKTVMPTMTFQYEYDLNGKMSKKILPSGIQTGYIYNQSGNIEEMRVLNKQNSTAASYNLAYDELGNLTSIKQNNEVLKSFVYTNETNLLSKQVVGLFTQTYDYDEKESLKTRFTNYKNDFGVQENISYNTENNDIESVTYKIGDVEKQI